MTSSQPPAPTEASSLLTYQNQPTPTTTGDSNGIDVDKSSPVEFESSSLRSRIASLIRRTSMPTWMVLSVCCAVGAGFAIQQADPSENVIKCLRYPGELFINSLKLMILPLIFFSMLCLPTNFGDLALAKKVGSRAVLYYLGTTFVAVAESVLMSNVIKPGNYADIDESAIGPVNPTPNDPDQEKASFLDSMLTIGFNLVPGNLFETIVENNILGVITFALAMGFMVEAQHQAAVRKAKKEGAEPPVNHVMVISAQLNKATQAVLEICIKFTPVGIFSLVVAEIASRDNLGSLMKSIGMMYATAFSAMALHIVIVYCGLYFLICKANPFKYLSQIRNAPLTALATGSSAASLPITMDVTKQAGAHSAVVNFMAPLGATINMDGTAVVYPLMVIFLGRSAGVELSLGKQVLCAFMSAFISIGAAPVPNAGMIYLVTILEAVDLPTDRGALPFVIAMDWFIDRWETALNVVGDSVGIAVVDKLVSKHLPAESKV